MIRAMFRQLGDRFHRWLDYTAPLDPSWASEPSTLDRPTMTFAEYADHARRMTEDPERPSGEHGDVPAIRNGLGGPAGPHERDDRWLGLSADERRNDGRVAS